MKADIVSRLKCPISGGTNLRIHAVEAARAEAIITDVPDAELRPSDDVHYGVIVETESGIAHPIAESIGIMLPNPSIQADRHVQLLADLLERVPTDLRPAIRETLEGVQSARGDHTHTDWDRGEMSYYDREVADPSDRQKMVDVLRTTPHWGTFLPRRRYILEYVASLASSGPLLEVGCGSARTISWNHPPARHHYRYVGLDISFGRLLVARELIPEGDFIQGSAVQLPFRDSAVPTIVAFGTIHHLPDQAACIRECHRVLSAGGLLGFHEPISKPQLFPKAIAARRLLATYEHSERDLEIDAQQTVALLQSLGMRIHTERYLLSPVRTVVESILNRLPRLMRIKWIARATQLVDTAFLATFGRLRKSLGPHAVALVAPKSATRQGRGDLSG